MTHDHHPQSTGGAPPAPLAAMSIPAPRVPLIARYLADRSPHVRSRWVRAEGRWIHVREAGEPSRPPIVLVHGLGVSSAYMVRLAERLRHEWRVIAPDLPGHGKSEAPRRALDVDALATSLRAILDALALPPAAMIGNSLGCQVLLALAAREPERVRGLLLIGPTTVRGTRSFAVQFARLVAGAPFERPSLIPILLADYLRMLPRIVGEVRATLRDRPEVTAREVRVPVLLVRGRWDPLTSRRWLDELAAALGGAPVHEVPGWGHALNHSVPGRVAALARDFLAPASPPAVMEEPPMKRQVEGNNEQRRAAAREAKEQGKSPSEMGATTGASKQLHSVGKDASHQERLEAKNRGKAQNTRQGKDKPRPGNRDEDPKRTERYG